MSSTPIAPKPLPLATPPSRAFTDALRAVLVAAAAPVALTACSSPQTPVATDPPGTAAPTTTVVATATSVPTTVPTLPATVATAVTTSTAAITPATEKLSRPGWRHGAAYCIAEVDTHKAGAEKSNRSPEGCDLDWADPKLRTLPDQPNGMFGYEFDPAATKDERAKVKDACCYGVDRPERGRPLRADDEARTAIVAESASRSDWLVRVACDASALDPADRARLADAWASDAALEHASIAEFSRVTLSLMALGAPPDLLQKTHEAALDEVRHAELSFGLASALAQRSIGPGPLPLDASKPSHVVPGESGRVSFAKATLADGCVGETIASIEAALASEGAVGELATILRGIADDEARHATLAFATVAWLLGGATADERAAITAFVREQLARIDAELASPAEDVPEGPTDALDATWGRVSKRDAARVRRDALRGAVRPALAALVGDEARDVPRA
ncbi:MAG: ferritin-like domain-containing protein [Polyangiaceae bacterium]